MRESREERLGFIDGNFDRVREEKKICIVGCGGVGSNLAMLLARSNFLNLVLVDFDLVDKSNLSRQSFLEKDIGREKAECLGEHIISVNNECKIEMFNEKLDENNSERIFDDCDLIVDATDNFETRKTINSYCERNKKDWLYNGAIRSEFVSCLFKGEDMLFEKVFPKGIEDEKAEDVGVLNSTPFICAGLAYNKILKYFLGIKDNNMIKGDFFKEKFFNIKTK